MRTRILVIALVAALLAVASPASACNKANLTGCVAPELNMLGGLNGASAATKLRAWRGKPILIEFWAPNCSPCKRILPEVERLHQRYKKKGLKVLAISLGTEKQSAAIIKKSKLTMPVGIDTLQKTMAKYKVKAIPAAFLVDRNGVVRPTGANLESAIKRELRRGSKKGGKK